MMTICTLPWCILLASLAYSEQIPKSNKLVLRVCDGPSCNPQGSYDVYKYLKNNELDSGFDVALGQCINACKRSCNVAVVPKGDFSGCVVPGMSQYEISKRCFAQVNSIEQMDRVISLVKDFAAKEYT